MVSFPDERSDTNGLPERLTGTLIGLARATEGNDHMVTDSTVAVMLEALAATAPDANCSANTLLSLLNQAEAEKQKLVPECYRCASPCGRTKNYDLRQLQKEAADICKLKLQILSLSRQVAACKGAASSQLLFRALFSVGMSDWEMEDLLPIVQELENER